MTFLLEVAAGDVAALKRACQKTGRSESSLREAAGFFIEQVLLARNTDSYRVLGARTDTPSGDVRRHMALLLKWLHPDVAARNETQSIDRSVFANRITLAWEDLKTKERRKAYDLSKPTQSVLRHPNASPRRQKDTVQRALGKRRYRFNQSKPRQRKSVRPVFFRVERQGLLNWLFRLLRGYR